MGKKEREFWRRLGRGVGAMRRGIGLSTSDLAFEVGMAQSTLESVESGRRRVSAYTLHRIEKRLRAQLS